MKTSPTHAALGLTTVIVLGGLLAACGSSSNAAGSGANDVHTEACRAYLLAIGADDTDAAAAMRSGLTSGYDSSEIRTIVIPVHDAAVAAGGRPGLVQSDFALYVGVAAASTSVLNSFGSDSDGDSGDNGLDPRTVIQKFTAATRALRQSCA